MCHFADKNKKNNVTKTEIAFSGDISRGHEKQNIYIYIYIYIYTNNNNNNSNNLDNNGDNDSYDGDNDNYYNNSNKSRFLGK